MTEILPNTSNDIGNRGCTNTTLAQFKGKPRQVLVNIEDAYRLVVMDGSTLGGKFKAASLDELNSVKNTANSALTKTDADAAYLAKSATAAKATADANGKKIHETYTAKSGDRGSITAYATTQISTTDTTINDSADENICVTGVAKITVNNGTAGKSWDKTVDIRNASCSITLGNAWAWAGGKAPEVTANCVLSLHWAKDKGMAVLIATE